MKWGRRGGDGGVGADECGRGYSSGHLDGGGALGLSTKLTLKSIFIWCWGVSFKHSHQKNDLFHNYVANIMKRMHVCEEVKHTDRAIHWHCQHHPASILPPTSPLPHTSTPWGPGRCVLSHNFFSSDTLSFSSWPCLQLRVCAEIKVVGASHNPATADIFLCPNLLPLPFAESTKPLGTPICIFKEVQLHGILRVTSPTKTTSDKTSTLWSRLNQLKDLYACSNTYQHTPKAESF